VDYAADAAILFNEYRKAKEFTIKDKSQLFEYTDKKLQKTHCPRPIAEIMRILVG